jgi:hypothetical protein
MIMLRVDYQSAVKALAGPEFDHRLASDRIRGMSVNLVVYDEVSEIDPEHLRTVLAGFRYAQG